MVAVVGVVEGELVGVEVGLLVGMLVAVPGSGMGVALVGVLEGELVGLFVGQPAVEVNTGVKVGVRTEEGDNVMPLEQPAITPTRARLKRNRFRK